MLFQGQEFAASSPFLFFADHKAELAESMKQGRIDFLQQFPSMTPQESKARVADPGDPSTFERSKLDRTMGEPHKAAWRLHRDLLKLRREDRVFQAQQKGAVDGAVLAADAFLLRFFGGDEGDRLILVNVGLDLGLNPSPEPLLAPPQGAAWELIWSSENPEYGGGGTPPLETDDNWKIPGHATYVLTSAILHE